LAAWTNNRAERAVDAKGEVLEVLVQANGDKRAAAKLKRKLRERKLQGFAAPLTFGRPSVNMFS
jgi:hypothetical protein